MNVEIGAEAAQFPEKEYINGIAFAVYKSTSFPTNRTPKNVGTILCMSTGRFGVSLRVAQHFGI